MTATSRSPAGAIRSSKNLARSRTGPLVDLHCARLSARVEVDSAHAMLNLVAGISEWTIELARAFRETDVRVVLVDSNYEATTRARMRGVTAFNASITSEFATDELDHSGIGRLT